jgi:hypothetical protein
MFLFWINTTLDLGPNFIGAFAERHEGAVPVFVRGSDTLFLASLFFDQRELSCTRFRGHPLKLIQSAARTP